MQALVQVIRGMRVPMLLVTSVIFLAATACSTGSVPTNTSQLAAPTAPSGQSVRGFQLRSWAINLTQINVGRIAQSQTDLVIVDANGVTPAQIAQMKRRPDGGRRIVLGYLNVGEAETFRGYWQSNWNRSRPDWIGRPNPNWPGHYYVEYWSPQWKSIIAGSVDYIVGKGFDGVFLDSVDKYQVWNGRQRQARQDMVSLVKSIAQRGRAKNRRFLVVPNNAEDLLTDGGYVATIDAVVKESLFYGVPRLGARNARETVNWSLTRLKRAQRAKKPILVIEYVNSPRARNDVARQIAELGMLVTFGRRDLARLTTPVMATPNAVSRLERAQ